MYSYILTFYPMIQWYSRWWREGVFTFTHTGSFFFLRNLKALILNSAKCDFVKTQIESTVSNETSPSPLLRSKRTRGQTWFSFLQTSGGDADFLSVTSIHDSGSKSSQGIQRAKQLLSRKFILDNFLGVVNICKANLRAGMELSSRSVWWGEQWCICHWSWMCNTAPSRPAPAPKATCTQWLAGVFVVPKTFPTKKPCVCFVEIFFKVLYTEVGWQQFLFAQLPLGRTSNSAISRRCQWRLAVRVGIATGHVRHCHEQCLLVPRRLHQSPMRCTRHPRRWFVVVPDCGSWGKIGLGDFHDMDLCSQFFSFQFLRVYLPSRELINIFM